MAPEAEVEEGLLPETEDMEVIDAEIIERHADDQPPASTPPAESDKPKATVPDGTAKTATPAKPKPVNLDEFDEFRRYKSERDRKEGELRRQLEERERILAEREAQANQAQIASLSTRISESADDRERQDLIEQMAAIRAQSYMTQERRWAQHVQQRATDEGLNPQDFEPTKYRGEAGALQFERDLAQAAKDNLRKRLADAEKASSPEALEARISQAVAKALRAKGIDVPVETGRPTAPDTGDSMARDLELLKQDKLTPAKFRERWGR